MFVFFSRKTEQIVVEEVRFECHDDAADGIVLEESNDHGARSVVDSGVGNTSVHSEENGLGPDNLPTGHSGEMNLLSIPDEGPVMTSSPRPSRDERSLVAEMEINAAGGHENNKEIGTEIDRHATDEPREKDIQDTGPTETTGIVLFANTGETETDDERDDDDNVAKPDVVRLRKRSKRKSDKKSDVKFNLTDDTDEDAIYGVDKMNQAEKEDGDGDEVGLAKRDDKNKTSAKEFPPDVNDYDVAVAVALKEGEDDVEHRDHDPDAFTMRHAVESTSL